MPISEKILDLRKKNGLSQEQLAEKLAVSRQAVSKWELGESTPDIEKIGLISDLFKVTTDYLIKEVQPEPRVPQDITTTGTSSGKVEDNNSNIVNIMGILASAIIASGLLLAWGLLSNGVGLAYQPPMNYVPGLILQIIGIALYESFQLKNNKLTRTKNRYRFYRLHVWLLLPLPILFVVSRLFLAVVARTYHTYSIGIIVPFFAAALVYLLLGLTISVILAVRYKNHR